MTAPYLVAPVPAPADAHVVAWTRSFDVGCTCWDRLCAEGGASCGG